MSESSNSPAGSGQPTYLPADQSVEFEFSLTGLNFRYKGPSHRVGSALQNGLQQSLNGLMNTQRVVMAEPDSLPALPTQTGADGQASGTEDGQAGGSRNGTSTSKKKARTGTGTPVKELLQALKAEGYFTAPRDLEAIQTKLKEKGHTVGRSSLSTRLQEVTQRGELHRQQSDGAFVYKDSPFQ